MENAELLDILRQFSISEYMQKTEIDTSRGSDYRLNLNVDQKYVVQYYDFSVLSETGSGKDASASGVHPAMKPFAAAGPPSAPGSFFAFAGVVATDHSGLACPQRPCLPASCRQFRLPEHRNKGAGGQAPLPWPCLPTFCRGSGR